MRSPAAILAALIACLFAIFAPAAAVKSSDRPVILIAAGGVMWEYINETDTPHLYEFSQTASIGSISVRTVHPATCPSEGWLTLGAGERVGDSVTDEGACRLLEEPLEASGGEAGWIVPHWNQYEAFAEDSVYSPHIGQLGDLTADMDTLAVGPGAGIALADSGGRISDYGSLTELTDKAPGKDLVLVDLGAITELRPTVFDNFQSRPTGDPLRSSFVPHGWNEEQIKAEMKELDERLGQVLENLKTSVPEAEIIIASLSDYSATASTLQAIMSGSDKPGMLTSATTRREGLVTITDLLPTLVQGSDGPGTAMIAVDGGTAAHNRAAAAELESLTQAIKYSTGPMYAMWGFLWLAVFFATLVFRRSRVLHGGVLTVASLPAASVAMNLLPWHSGGEPTVVLLAGTLLISSLFGVAALHLRGQGREFPAGFVAAVTLVAYLLPVLTGSPLALNSVFGALPQVGRFYGMTNMMFAIVGVAGLILAGVIASRISHRTSAAFLIVVLGALVVFIDGSPWHGADFGGPAVLTIAFALIARLVMGRVITAVNAGGIILASGLVTAAFAVADYLRPIEERTHLGGFVESVMDGSAMGIIVRKAGQVLALWPLILLIVAALAVVLIVIRKRGFTITNPLDPEGSPWLWVSAAIVIVLLGGMPLNDSGPIIIVVGGMVAIPLVASATSHENWRRDDAGHEGSANAQAEA